MADKQAVVYVIDLGSTTGECHNGRVETDLDYGMRYVWSKIGETMAANRPATWSVGALGFRTDETDNTMDEDESYKHICVLKPLGPMEMPSLMELKKKIITNNTDTGDAISAIIIAIDMIEKFTTLKTGKLGKFTRKVVLLTDGQGGIDGDDIDAIAQRLNELEIQLVVIGIDFDDEEFGFVENDKSSVKQQNERSLKTLTEKCKDSLYGTAAEAINDLDVPRTKKTRPYATFKGTLCLGDYTKYPETTMCIDVERYFRTKQAKPASASSYVTKVVFGHASTQSSHTLQGGMKMEDMSVVGDLSAVKNMIKYTVKDESAIATAGKLDVAREELAKGFAYGSTAVHISESDENVTRLETFQGFSIIGFIPWDNYERFLNIGESCITIAPSNNDKAKLALSSFIHALYELESYAVARIVMKDGKDPQLILLAPSIEPDLEALIDVPLPFAEDVRVYRFPPLDKVYSTSGGTITKHRFLPTDRLSNAMGDYVNSMDLSTLGKDDEGQPMEYMTIDETYSPLLHRINQAISKRAVQPDEPVQPPAEVLLKWSKPPEELVKASESKLKQLIKVADVKKVPPKAKGRRGKRDPIKPLSGLDVDSLLDREKRQKIDPANPIPELKQILSHPDNYDVVNDAIRQMSSIIRSQITKSLGNREYAQQAENMRVLRDELSELEYIDQYNDFVRDLKSRLIKGELGGDRREFWLEVRRSKLGLVHLGQHESSEVTEEEAKEFYSLSSDLPSRKKS